jgi:hypothetical protein
MLFPVRTRGSARGIQVFVFHKFHRGIPVIPGQCVETHLKAVQAYLIINVISLSFWLFVLNLLQCRIPF